MGTIKKFDKYIKEEVDSWDDMIDDIPDFDEESEKPKKRPAPRKKQTRVETLKKRQDRVNSFVTKKKPKVKIPTEETTEETTEEISDDTKPKKKKLVRSEEGNIKLRYAAKFRKILKILQTRKDSKKISDKFIDDFRKLDCDISFFNLVEDNSEQLSYLPRNRIMGIKRVKNKKGRMVLKSYDNNQRQQMRIGRIINRLWPNEFTAREVELFVNEFKGEHDMITGNINIQLVQGDDIYKWYQGKMYAGGGSLGQSCMKNMGKAQAAMYTENPNQIRMAIYTRAGKLEARAIVWTTDRGIFMDRIYYTKDHLTNAFRRYAERNGWMYKNQEPEPERLTVRLEHRVRLNNPYLDTFAVTNNGTRAEAFGGRGRGGFHH